MNVILAVPTPIAFNTGTVNTEAVRRDNTQREAFPALSSAEKSRAESGVGADADRAKAPGQPPPAVTYDKPISQSEQAFANQQDNGEDASAGKENAEQRQQEQAEKQQLLELKQRDTEVRAHEQAHAAVGGQYAAAPQYEYEIGPDGRQYVVSGKVSIDVSKASTPEETLRKAQQVKAAALAPAEPSSQDLRVASEATQIAREARVEIANVKAEQAQQAFTDAKPEALQGIKESDNSQPSMAPELEDIVDGIDVTAPTRSLKETAIQGLEEVATNLTRSAANPYVAATDVDIRNRVSVIQNFYQQIGVPREEGLRQSA